MSGVSGDDRPDKRGSSLHLAQKRFVPDVKDARPFYHTDTNHPALRFTLEPEGHYTARAEGRPGVGTGATMEEAQAAWRRVAELARASPEAHATRAEGGGTGAEDKGWLTFGWVKP